MINQKNEQGISNYTDIFNKLSNSSCEPNDFDFFINIYFDEVIHYIKTDILQSNLKNLQEQERTIKRIANKLELFEQEQLKTSYQLGVLKSILSLAQKHQVELKKSNCDFYVKKLEQNQQLCKMIIILYDKNSINHQELADSLHITKSALSNMIKRTQDLELYSTKRHGKFKYYYSNYRTKEVYKKYMDKNINQKYTQSEVDNIISSIFIALSQEIKNNQKINTNNIIQKLPYNLTSPQKNVVCSIENFTREYNYNISNDYLNAIKPWINYERHYEQQYKNILIPRVQKEEINYE